MFTPAHPHVFVLQAQASALGLKTIKEWDAWCKSEARPSGIPTAPHQTYKGKGWQGYGHWLGTAAGQKHGSKRSVGFFKFIISFIFTMELYFYYMELFETKFRVSVFWSPPFHTHAHTHTHIYTCLRAVSVPACNLSNYWLGLTQPTRRGPNLQIRLRFL